jgi:hypothetical protein
MLSRISVKLSLLACRFLFISINQLIVQLAPLSIDVNQVIDYCYSLAPNPAPPSRASKVGAGRPTKVSPCGAFQLVKSCLHLCS